MRRPLFAFNQLVSMTSGMLLVNFSFAASCLDLGLVKNSSAVMQLQEGGRQERSVVTYRDRDQKAWFLPLSSDSVGNNHAERWQCIFEGVAYWKVGAADTALQYEDDNNGLTFLDLSQVTHVIEGRKTLMRPRAQTLDSAGVNYQLALDYAAKHFNLSAYTEWYAHTDGWYLSTNLGLNRVGRITRFDTYALKESLNAGTFLRLGDAVSYPTPLGESQQFSGLSWGTDQNLRPGDFAPVLPTLRNSNVIPGPLEVFINDTLQFQQTLQNGVYDLRNIPVQNGFNSYTVRTIDALGNTVTVQREIYLPASLLPPGIARWRVDAGFQRQDAYTSNFHYGAPFLAASYATGINHNVTTGGYALVSKAVSTFAGEYDQRLSKLWTGHLGLLSAKNTQQQGYGIQARIEGSRQRWRFIGERMHALKPLPSIGSRTALVMQQLVRAQLSGIAGWNIALALAKSQREFVVREDVAVLSASTNIHNSGASIALSLSQTRSAGGRQQSLTLSLFIPLSADNHKSHSLLGSQTNADGLQLSRVQYSSSAWAQQDPSWNVGVTQSSPEGLPSIDGAWSRKTDKLELQSMGRVGSGDFNGQVSLRSGLLWAGGSMFSTRPVEGAFALVSTAQEGVEIFHENRFMGKTDARGMLLVLSLRALEPNHLSVNPATWPIT